MRRALTAARGQIKLLNMRTPPNGFVIYSGGGNVCVMVQPPRPILDGFYLCNRRFHTECLESMLEDEPAVGYVICDGSEAAIYTVRGKERKRLVHITSGTRGRTRRGGFSAARYQRLHDEAEYEFVKRICERMNACFLEKKGDSEGDLRVNVCGIIVAGKAGLKNQVTTCQVVDARLAKAVAKILDIEHEGNIGLSEALEKTTDLRTHLLDREERAAVEVFYNSVQRNDGLNIYGLKQTLAAITAGAVETALVSRAFAEAQPSPLQDGSANLRQHLETICKKMRTDLVLARDSVSAPGHQVCKDFGSVFATLRWPLYFHEEEPEEAEEETAAAAEDESSRAILECSAYLVLEEDNQLRYKGKYQDPSATASPPETEASRAPSPPPANTTSSSSSGSSPEAESWEQLLSDAEEATKAIDMEASKAGATFYGPKVISRLDPTAAAFVPTFVPGGAM